MARIQELRRDPATLCQRARAGIDVLAAQPQVDGRIAAVGYCFGGMTVLELARSGMEVASRQCPREPGHLSPSPDGNG